VRLGWFGRWLDPESYRYLRRWFDPGWYRYLRRKYPDRLAVVAIFVLGLLGFAGYSAVAATGGGSATPTLSRAYVPLTTTVIRTVKAYEPGHVVVKRVTVVKRVAAAPVTVLKPQVIRTPAGTQVVTRPVLVYRATTVRVHGNPVTVKSVVTNTKTTTQLTTVTNEVTNEHTSTVVQKQTQTATVTRTATAPAQTVTVTGPTSTATVTTQVTSPPKTVTETVTVTTTKKGP